MKRTDYQSVMPSGGKGGFQKVPNCLMDDFYSGQPKRRNKALLYLCLLRNICFIDGEKVLNGQKIICRKGEWVTTYRELEIKSGIPKSKIGRLLTCLVDEGHISTRCYGRFTIVSLPENEQGKEKPAPGGDGNPSFDSRIPSVTSALGPNYKRLKI